MTNLLEAAAAIFAYLLLEWNRTGHLQEVELLVPACILVIFVIRTIFPRNVSRVYRVVVNDKTKEIEFSYYNPYEGRALARIPFEQLKLRISRKRRTGYARYIEFYPKNRQTFELRTGRRKFSQEDLNTMADHLERLTHVS